MHVPSSRYKGPPGGFPKRSIPDELAATKRMKELIKNKNCGDNVQSIVNDFYLQMENTKFDERFECAQTFVMELKNYITALDPNDINANLLNLLNEFDHQVSQLLPSDLHPGRLAQVFRPIDFMLALAKWLIMCATMNLRRLL